MDMYLENNTKVKTPDGYIGRLRVTRRERRLIAEGKITKANVLGSDGLTRRFDIGDIEMVIRKVPSYILLGDEDAT